jgi:hypothetical protein
VRADTPGTSAPGMGLSFTDTTSRGRLSAACGRDSRGSGRIGRNTVAEILLALLAEALGAALVGLVLIGIRRAIGAARA